MACSLIRDFYNSQNIFVTGGTGFLGKVLIEKLLRSTNVATIYVLIRDKMEKNAQTRLNEMFNNVLFDKLRNEKPLSKNRVVAISGDCISENLGLSVTDEQKLVSNVNIVFHGAATLLFNENIKLAYNMNVKGTESLLKLCKKMTSLKSFVHVSTAYSNCHLCSIDETIYNSSLKNREVEDTLKNLSAKASEKITQQLITPWPNTYTFTKALAEGVIKDNAGTLPLGIFRPGIVTSTYKEPLENWNDSFAGPSMVLKRGAEGLIRILPCDRYCNTDVVPVDLTISALIATAWDVAKHDQKNIPVYNYISSNDNPITYLEFFYLNALQFKKYPLTETVWAPHFRLRKESTLTNILMMLHFYPLLFLHLLDLIYLKKPEVVSKMKKTQILIETLTFFMNREWNFSNKNIKIMWDKMNENDRNLFNFDITSVQWTKYLRNYFKGLRVYLMQDDLSTLPDARTKLRKLQMAHQILLVLTYFVSTGSVFLILSKL